MTNLIEQLVNKMGLQDETQVLQKTTELVRLLDLRSSNVPIPVNECSKIVLCADIAASVLGIGFDKEQALKLSALRKTHYANHKRMLEKMLEINRIIGINEICVQLNLNELKNIATDMLELYKSVVANEQMDEDMAHPQYAAMAVFYAGKLKKHKISKTKLMPYSNLRPTQWQHLEQRWEKFMTKHYKAGMESQLVKQSSIEISNEINENKTKKIKTNKVTEVEDYEIWKKRMIHMAETGLKEKKQ